MLSNQIEEFIGRLEVDEIKTVTLNTVRTKWLPKIVHLEKVNADLLEACKFALQQLRDMTSKEFAHGADRAARERLEKAIENAND